MALQTEASGRCVVAFEMVADEETLQAFSTRKVPWWDPDGKSDYRCDGIDPAVFDNRRGLASVVPMKASSPDHKVALEWFARAGRAGAPKYIIQGSLPEESALEHILKGEIQVHAEQQTFGFVKPMNKTN